MMKWIKRALLAALLALALPHADMPRVDAQTYSNVFGGSAVTPSPYSYNALTISANTTLSWPSAGQPAGATAAAIMDVTATVGGLSLALPSALNQAPGASVLLTNVGSNSFTLTDNVGGNLGTIVAGQEWIFYLRNTTTQAGTWGSAQLAALTSQALAGSLAGNGLVAISSLLNVNLPTDSVNSGFTIATSDRARSKLWVGAGATINLPLAATATNGFFFGVRNQGSAQVIIQPAGGQLINGQASITMVVGDSTVILCDGTQWYEIGGVGAIPSSLPPNGPAGGDLGANYPSPTVVNAHLASPLPVAQGGTGNTTGAPAGAAAGDLGGTYPNPTVVATHLGTPLPPSQGGSASYVGGATTGTASVQVLATVVPGNYARTPGNRITFLSGFNSTTGMTLNINTTGAVVVQKRTSSGLTTIVSGDMTAGMVYNVVDDGVSYELLDPTAGSGSGTVTSVGLALPGIFSVSGSPVTGAGTLTGTLATQSANTVWAGPTTGAANTPTFRPLVAADLPGGSTSPATDIQTFTAIGANTWTKPGGYGANSITHIECWAGGGSGAKAGGANGSGGGGGAYKDRFIAMSSLGATETVTIGAGGTAVSTNNTNGNNGGNTTFGTWLTAYGGAGGNTSGTGGAGGAYTAALASAAATTDAPGGEGSGATNAPLNANIGINLGGGGGFNGTTALSGKSVWGGGGGGGANVNDVGNGGTSQFGGNGGNSTSSTSNAGAGTQPGGGGGGHSNSTGNSGAGGAGKCIATSTSG